MDLILGFDPGGVNAFGWCIIEDTHQLPLRIRCADAADNAEAALVAVARQVPVGARIMAAGIDAPMFWSPRGDRKADQTVRASLREKDAASPSGTVQAVNSLRGACVAQGVMIAWLLRDRWGGLTITEAHPKALLWTVGIASVGKPAASITLNSLAELFAAESSVPAAMEKTDHVRDAALAAYCAWAMIHQAVGWRDLLVEEPEPFLPIPGPLSYWYPFASVALALLARRRSLLE